VYVFFFLACFYYAETGMHVTTQLLVTGFVEKKKKKPLAKRAGDRTIFDGELRN
jgi:hypothetical protein